LLTLRGPSSHPSVVPRCQQASVLIALIFHMADVETCDALAVQIVYELFEYYRVRFPVRFRFFPSNSKFIITCGGAMWE
jgi:hypothetical protein